MSTKSNDAAKSLRDQANAILAEVRSLDVSKWSMSDVFVEIERHQVSIGETLLAIATEELLPREMTEAINRQASKWKAWKSRETVRGETRRPLSELARRRTNERCWFVGQFFIGSLGGVLVARGDCVSRPSHAHTTEAYREHIRFQKRKQELRLFSARLEKLIAWAEQAIEEPPKKPKRGSHYHPIFRFNDELKRSLKKSASDKLTRRDIAKAYIRSLSPKVLAAEIKEHGRGEELENYYMTQLRNHKEKLQYP